MPTTVTLPASLDDAVAELTGIGELLTATEWHRAAIIASFVRLDIGRGGRETADSSHFVSARRFADLGVRGLSHHSTVAHYVQCWLEAHGDNYPPRGRTIELPADPWPPQARNLGSRMTKNKIRELPVADLIDAIDQRVEAGDVSDDELLELRRVTSIGGDYEPSPGRISDRGKSDEELATDAYWKKVRAALYLLVDVKGRIADEEGLDVPGDIAILLQILVPESDWDEAVHAEINKLP